MPKRPDENPARKCFVICPIGSKGSEERRHSDNLFHDVIEEALRPIGFENIDRGDKVDDPGIINDQIINYILDADLIIADLSFQNPNAFYELGIADHAGKPVVLFCREGEEIPFDKLHDRVIIADLDEYHERQRARHSIAKSAEAALKPGFEVSNPVSRVKAIRRMEVSADPQERIIADLQRSVEELKRETHSLSRQNFVAVDDLASKDISDVEVVNRTIGTPSTKPLRRSEISEICIDLPIERREQILERVQKMIRNYNLGEFGQEYALIWRDALES